MKEKRIIKYLFVDPQATDVIGKYDYNLLSNLPLDNLGYITNTMFDVKVNGVYCKALFNYINKPLITKGFSYGLSLYKLFLFFWKYRPLIVHVNWIRIPRLEYWYYRLTKRVFGFKLVYTAHNVLPHNTGNKYSNIYKKIYELTDAVIVHSRYTREEMNNLGVDSNKVHVIKHGAFEKADNKGAQDLDFRKQYHLEGKIIFTIVGTQSTYKGTDLAIDAWVSSPVLSASNNVVLVIMGKNFNLDYSKAKQTSNIIIIDRFFTNEEHSSLLEATDVLLLPYRSISQSGVLLHSLSYHIPLIVSRVGGLAETLEEANIGWSIKPDNMDELREAIELLVKHPDEISKVKEDESEWVKILKYYSWEDIGQNTKRLYLGILSND